MANIILKVRIDLHNAEELLPGDKTCLEWLHGRFAVEYGELPVGVRLYVKEAVEAALDEDLVAMVSLEAEEGDPL